MLRKRAITRLYDLGFRIEEVARTVGMDVRTAWRYYLDMRKIDSTDKFREMAEKLIPAI